MHPTRVRKSALNELFTLRAHDRNSIGDHNVVLQDTYGPALNILIKLMAIISVVFAPVVADKQFGGLLFDQLLSTWGQKDAPAMD